MQRYKSSSPDSAKGVHKKREWASKRPFHMKRWGKIVERGRGWALGGFVQQKVTPFVFPYFTTSLTFIAPLFVSSLSLISTSSHFSFRLIH